MLFKVGCFDKACRDGVCINKAFKDLTTLIDLVLPLFKLKEGIPGVLSWLPCHPVLENLPRALDLTQLLFHEGILVPELIDPWKVLAGSLKALVVIQASYDLDTVKLMDGLDETGRENLGLDDLVNLCDTAYKYNLLNSAVDFLRAALVWIRRHPQKEG